MMRPIFCLRKDNMNKDELILQMKHNVAQLRGLTEKYRQLPKSGTPSGQQSSASFLDEQDKLQSEYEATIAGLESL